MKYCLQCKQPIDEGRKAAKYCLRSECGKARQRKARERRWNKKPKIAPPGVEFNALKAGEVVVTVTGTRNGKLDGKYIVKVGGLIAPVVTR